MQWHTLNLIPPKGLVFFLLALCFIWEFRKGYFKKFPAFLADQDWRPYTQLFFSFFSLSLLFLWIDSSLLRGIQSVESPVFHYATAVGRTLGYGSYPWLLLIAFYILTRALRQMAWHRAAFRCIFSAGLTALIAHLFKIFVLRARPYEGSGPFSFFNFPEVLKGANTYFSFPSGDVAVVAGIFCYLTYRTKNYLLGWVSLLFPLFTACSRIELNKHWPSDTLMAIGLGFCMGLLVFNYDDYLHKEKIAL